MTNLDQIMAFNRDFVASKSYERFKTDRYPAKKMVILTCMDTRLIELLPNAMNIKNGDVKIIKNAGAIVTHPFGSVMRSILVAVYQLGAQEILVVGHHQCGMTGLRSEQILDHAVARGVPETTIRLLQNSGLNLSHWLSGFESVQKSVLASVDLIRNHPLLPTDIAVHGLIIHPETGALDILSEGYTLAGGNKGTGVVATS